MRADAALKAVVGSTITGQVFVDTNSDGAFNASDSGENGQTVYLDANNNGVLDTATTSPSSTNVPKTISDRTTVDSTLAVSGVNGLVTDANVTVSITHNSDSDLQVLI